VAVKEGILAPSSVLSTPKGIRLSFSLTSTILRTFSGIQVILALQLGASDFDRAVSVWANLGIAAGYVGSRLVSALVS
jgi:hypothetical protein